MRPGASRGWRRTMTTIIQLKDWKLSDTEKCSFKAEFDFEYEAYYAGSWYGPTSSAAYVYDVECVEVSDVQADADCLVSYDALVAQVNAKLGSDPEFAASIDKEALQAVRDAAEEQYMRNHSY